MEGTQPSTAGGDGAPTARMIGSKRATHTATVDHDDDVVVFVASGTAREYEYIIPYYTYYTNNTYNT